MHIPDGFLTPGVSLGMGAASAVTVTWMARRAQGETEESRAPLLGVMGAFVFAAQMINFPVGVGTTGHLLGGALLAFTLGPASAIIVMTAILAIQALVFQDGGVLALGANVFNMAVAGVLAGYLPYHFLGRGRARGIAIFLGGALSVITCALLALAELWFSGVRMPGAILALSLALFAVAAALEGLITLGVMRAVGTMNPGWIRKPPGLRRPALAAIAVAAALLAVVGVFFASTAPDGLEKLADNLGVASRARTLFSTPLAGYETQFLVSPWVRKATAGAAGLVLVYVTVLWLGRMASSRKGS
jgi:cobalt/nickel transport system permease protein